MSDTENEKTIEYGSLPWHQLNTSGTLLDSNGEPVAICLSHKFTEFVLAAVNFHASGQQLIKQLVEALRELTISSIEFEDKRLSHVALQVDREALQDARDALDAAAKMFRETFINNPQPRKDDNQKGRDGE